MNKFKYFKSILIYGLLMLVYAVTADAFIAQSQNQSTSEYLTGETYSEQSLTTAKIVPANIDTPSKKCVGDFFRAKTILRQENEAYPLETQQDTFLSSIKTVSGRSYFASVDPMGEANPYTYAGSRPLFYNDPDGEFLNILIGAGIGAAIGGGLEIGGQFVGNYMAGKNVFDPANYDSGKIVGATVSGAIVGGVAGATGGGSLIVMGIAGAGSEFVGQAAEKGWNSAGLGLENKRNDNPFDLESYNYGKVAAGGVFGVVGAGAGKVAGNIAPKGVGRPVKNVYKSLARKYWGPNVSATLQRKVLGQFISLGLTKSFSGKENLSTIFNQAGELGINILPAIMDMTPCTSP